MRALVFENKLRYRTDYPMPRAKKGEALIRVTLAGICGTDLEITKGYDTQIILMTRLAGSNLSNVDPHPVIKYILYSHPPIMERIGYAEDRAKKQ